MSNINKISSSKFSGDHDLDELVIGFLGNSSAGKARTLVTDMKVGEKRSHPQFQYKVRNTGVENVRTSKDNKTQKVFNKLSVEALAVKSAAEKVGCPQARVEELLQAQRSVLKALAYLDKKVADYRGVSEKRDFLRHVFEHWSPQQLAQSLKAILVILENKNEDSAWELALSFVNEYRNLADHPLLLEHLEAYMAFPDDYYDFSQEQFGDLTPTALSAIKNGSYIGFVAAIDIYPHEKESIKLLVKKLAGGGALTDDPDLCGRMLREYCHGRGVLSDLLAIPVETVVDAYTVYMGAACYIDTTKYPFTLFLKAAVAHNAVRAARILFFLDDMSSADDGFFLKWVDGHDKGLGERLLILEKEDINAYQETLRDLVIMVDEGKALPQTLISLVTPQRLSTLKILVEWIHEGHLALVRDICSLYSSQSLSVKRFSRSVIKRQEIEAQMLLFLYKADSAWVLKNRGAIRSNEGVVEKKLSHPVLIKKLLTLISRDPASKQALKDWFTGLAPNSTLSEPSDLLLRMTKSDQEVIIALCCLFIDKTERRALLRAISSYPSIFFAKAFLYRLQEESNSEKREYIDSLVAFYKDPVATQEIANRLIIGTSHRRPITPLAGRWSFDKAEVLRALKEEYPSIALVINEILADTTSLGSGIATSLCCLYRYGVGYDLETLLPTSYASLNEERRIELLQWLELAHTGVLSEVQILAKIPEASLRRKAVRAGNLLEDRRLLKGVLALKEGDAEDKALLEDFIRDPADSWCRYLLTLRGGNKVHVYEQVLQATPKSKKTLKMLVDQSRTYVVEKALASGSKKYLQKLSARLENSPQGEKLRLDAVHRVWQKAGWVGGSIALSDKGIYEELQDEYTLAVAMAKALIDSKGHLSKGKIERLLRELPAALTCTDHGKYLIATLSFLKDSQLLRDKIVVLGKRFSISPIGNRMIQNVTRQKPADISKRDMSITLLSALLCRPRQRRGTCYLLGSLIRDHQSVEGLSMALDDYIEIIQKGELNYPSEINGKRPIPVLKQYLNRQKGAHAEHPLFLGRENALVVIGRQAAPSIKSENKSIIFNKFIHSHLNRWLCDNADLAEGIDLWEVISHLNQSFEENVLELHNPGSDWRQEDTSYWELVNASTLEPISSMDAYLALCEQVIRRYMESPFVTEAKGDLKERLELMAEFLLPYFEDSYEIKNFFNKDLKQEAYNIEKLWRSTSNGGFTNQILKTRYGSDSTLSFTFHPKSIDEVFLRIGEHCLDFPRVIKKEAAVDPGYTLPLNMPGHSLSLLPYDLLDRLDQLSPKEILEGLYRDLLQISMTSLSQQEIEELNDLLGGQFVGDKKVAIREAMRMKNSSHQTIGSWAHDALEVLGPLLRPGLSKRKIAKYVEIALWKHGDIRKESFCIFADSNWISEGHSDMKLAFGPSLAMGQIDIMMCTDSKMVSVLSFDPLDGPWDLYSAIHP